MNRRRQQALQLV